MSLSSRKIYWFAYYGLDSPSVRYRAKYPLDYLAKEKGCQSILVIPSYRPSAIFGFLFAWLFILIQPHRAVVVIQRVQSSGVFARMLLWLIKRDSVVSIYDLDDADYLLPNSWMIERFASHCSAMAVGSDAIQDYMAEYNSNVFFVPSPVPECHHFKRKRSEPFTLGWIGDYGGDHRLGFLKYIHPALALIDFPVRLVMMGVGEDFRSELQYIFEKLTFVELVIPGKIDWRNEWLIQEEISKWDVGLATLIDTPIQIAKSGIKVKQYLNSGVPVLCNPLAENGKLINHGENGFYCHSPEDFYEKLRYLKDLDFVRYSEMSTKASSSVAPFRHADHWIRWERILEEVIRPASLEKDHCHNTI